MKKIKDNIFQVYGNLYINRPATPDWLCSCPNSATIHVKGDVIFGCLEPPNRMRRGDYFLDANKFPQSIYDIVIFSEYIK